MTTDQGVVLDASALVVYARNDLQSLPVDELLRELREDTDGPVFIPELAYGDAQIILVDDKAALARLESLADAHGVTAAGEQERRAIAEIVADARVTPGLAHAMLLATVGRRSLATYVAPTLERIGYGASLVLDLDEMFRLE